MDRGILEKLKQATRAAQSKAAGRLLDSAVLKVKMEVDVLLQKSSPLVAKGMSLTLNLRVSQGKKIAKLTNLGRQLQVMIILLEYKS